MDDNVETHQHEIIYKGATRIKVNMASNAWAADFQCNGMLVRITITSAYFSVQTLDHRQTIRLFMGIKYMYSISDGLLDRSDQLQAVILRFSTIHI